MLDQSKNCSKIKSRDILGHRLIVYMANCRDKLRENKGLEIYLSLLDDEIWAVTALDSLAVCLAHDNEQRKVEQTLLQKEAVHRLVVFFQSCGGPTFVHILEPFLKIIR